MKTPRSIAATRFAARCLDLLDEVGRSGESLIVTRRGRAVVRILPIDRPRRSLAGSVTIRGDVFGPILDWCSPAAPPPPPDAKKRRQAALALFGTIELDPGYEFKRARAKKRLVSKALPCGR